MSCSRLIGGWRFFAENKIQTKTMDCSSRTTRSAADDDLWVREHVSFEIPLNEIGEPIFYLAHPLVDPVRCVLDFVQRFVRAAMDHLEALGHLVRDDVGFRATAVLSRAALEACAAASYLMSADVPPAERLRRLWNLQCEQLTDPVRRDASAAPDATRAREDVLAAAESVGFGREARETQRPLQNSVGVGQGRQTSFEHGRDD